MFENVLHLLGERPGELSAVGAGDGRAHRVVRVVDSQPRVHRIFAEVDIGAAQLVDVVAPDEHGEVADPLDDVRRSGVHERDEAQLIVEPGSLRTGHLQEEGILVIAGFGVADLDDHLQCIIGYGKDLLAHRSPS